MSEPEKQRLLADIPMGRLGREADIASAVRFLAEQAPFITGQVRRAEGGNRLLVEAQFLLLFLRQSQ